MRPGLRRHRHRQQAKGGVPQPFGVRGVEVRLNGVCKSCDMTVPYSVCEHGRLQLARPASRRRKRSRKPEKVSDSIRDLIEGWPLTPAYVR